MTKKLKRRDTRLAGLEAARRSVAKPFSSATFSFLNAGLEQAAARLDILIRAERKRVKG